MQGSKLIKISKLKNEDRNNLFTVEWQLINVAGMTLKNLHLATNIVMI